jgi:hypothetical protein
VFKFTLLFVWLLLINTNASAQHQEVSEKPATWKAKNKNTGNDTSSLLHAFKKGHLSGHFRYFFLSLTRL